MDLKLSSTADDTELQSDRQHPQSSNKCQNANRMHESAVKLTPFRRIKNPRTDSFPQPWDLRSQQVICQRHQLRNLHPLVSIECINGRQSRLPSGRSCPIQFGSMRLSRYLSIRPPEAVGLSSIRHPVKTEDDGPDHAVVDHGRNKMPSFLKHSSIPLSFLHVIALCGVSGPYKRYRQGPALAVDFLATFV
jgi:hypothetical protein